MKIRANLITSFQAILLAVWLMIAPTIYAADRVTDVRTVIDVSGSMKKNDPRNLRMPALKLLVRLMPEGSQSGVWTFGEYVNMNVKQGKVDTNWKNKAMSEAGKIHSRGLYTNIEEAIEKASYGWAKPDPNISRNLLLLTDGVVDLRKGEKVSNASRQRIMEELLPRLKKARVKIHTVALSKDADHELLKSMSSLTGGWYERVDNADQLQKVFLRLFEKSAAVDTLPITANTFQVDEHVKDMTLVLFRSKESKSAKVIAPDKSVISKDKHGNGVRWHQEQGYELITIKKPQPGGWQLETEEDPDNRVMVVTNLRLKVNPLPNNILLGDELTIKAHLSEDGKTISRQDFLQLVEFKLLQEPRDGEVYNSSMLDDGNKPDALKTDGVYSTALTSSLVDGQHMLAIKAIGPTFRREYRHLLNVFSSPAELKITRLDDGNYQFSLMPYLDILQPATISAQVKLADEKVITFTQEGSQKWLAVVPATYQEQVAVITLVGTRMDDKSLELQFERIVSDNKEGKAVSLAEKVADKPVEPELVKKEPEETTESEVVEEPEAKPVESEFSWTFVIVLIVGINLLLIVGGFVGYKVWKKRSDKQDADSENEMEL